MKAIQSIISILLTLLTLARGFPKFQSQIPNGAQVPDPCNRGQNWPGVGHESKKGANSRNPFGLDFSAANNVWTPAMCSKDSDGDGRTNGVELGDPNCTWTSGSQPTISDFNQLTHPGVCEPVNSTLCEGKNSWIYCADEIVISFSSNKTSNNSSSSNSSSNPNPNLNSNSSMPSSTPNMPMPSSSTNSSTQYCPAFSDPTTKNVSLTIPTFTIPTQVTTYMCISFVLPNDTQQLQAIGLTPIMNTTGGNPTMLVHHMLLYGCQTPPPESQFTTPFECSMGSLACLSLIGIWAVGSHGECFTDAYGIPIGYPKGFQYAMLQIHYNNPQLMPNLVDQSGMTLYYTSNLRPNNGMVVMFGQQYIDIPPSQSSFSITGTCVSGCTERINTTLNIPFAVLHMHLLGKSGTVQVLRNNTVVNTIVNDMFYDFSLPSPAVLNPPVQFLPGDEILVTCNYSTLSKNTTTLYGESTGDEMCYSFITMYPAVENFDTCIEWKDIPYCEINPELSYNGCDMTSFRNSLSQVAQLCNPDTCQTDPVCESIMANISISGCANGTEWEFIQYEWPQFAQDFTPLLDTINKCGHFESFNLSSGLAGGGAGGNSSGGMMTSPNGGMMTSQGSAGMMTSQNGVMTSQSSGGMMMSQSSAGMMTSQSGMTMSQSSGSTMTSQSSESGMMTSLTGGFSGSGSSSQPVVGGQTGGQQSSITSTMITGQPQTNMNSQTQPSNLPSQNQTSPPLQSQPLQSQSSLQSQSPTQPSSIQSSVQSSSQSQSSVSPGPTRTSTQLNTASTMKQSLQILSLIFLVSIFISYSNFS